MLVVVVLFTRNGIVGWLVDAYRFLGRRRGSGP
jgi:hypothetical protein